MKSKIRVEFDYVKNEPYIQILLDSDKHDPDLKDGMIKHFFEHAWNEGLRIEWPDQNPGFQTPQLRISKVVKGAEDVPAKKKDVRYRLEMLPEEYRLKAFENLYNKADLDKEAGSTIEALLIAFGAGSNGYFTSIQTKEGVDYWKKVAQEADMHITQLNQVNVLCHEILSTDSLEKWESIKKELIDNHPFL